MSSYFILKFGTNALLIFVCALPFIFKKAKVIFLGIAIFVLFLAPTYSPVLIASLVAERYLYFPSIGLSIAFAFFYEKLKEKYPVPKQARYILMFFILIMAACALRTLLRNEDWRSPATFWRETLATSPDSYQAHNAMGDIHYREGNIKEAIAEFKKAIKINPHYARAYDNMGKIFSSLGENEEAISLYNKAIKINPKYIDAYNNLGNAYIYLNNYEAAIVLYKKAIQINPDYAMAYSNLGIAYNHLGKYEEAIASYKKAIEINPNYADAYYNLAYVSNESGRREEAIGLYKKAININTKYVKAHYNLALLYYQNMQYDLAIKHCDRATKLGYKVDADFLKALDSFR